MKPTQPHVHYDTVLLLYVLLPPSSSMVILSHKTQDLEILSDFLVLARSPSLIALNKSAFLFFPLPYMLNLYQYLVVYLIPSQLLGVKVSWVTPVSDSCVQQSLAS